jgi:hypothetical protein
MASYTIGLGSGADYSTAVTWEDASPATLTEIYEGRFLNHSAHTGGVTEFVVISGQTTTSSFFMRLTHDTGQYHEGKPRHPTAAIVHMDNSKGGFRCDSDYTEILGINFAGMTNDNVNPIICKPNAAITIKVYDCIFQDVRGHVVLAWCNLSGPGNGPTIKMRNCLTNRAYGVLKVITNGSTDVYGPNFFIHNCTFQNLFHYPDIGDATLYSGGGGAFYESVTPTTDDTDVQLKNVVLEAEPYPSVDKLNDSRKLIGGANDPTFTGCDYVVTSDASASTTGATNYKHNFRRSVLQEAKFWTQGPQFSKTAEEGFEATGYDETGWTESAGGSSTINEDFTTSGVTDDTTWQTKCLEINKVGATDDVYVYRSTSDAAAQFTRCEFIVDSGLSLGTSESFGILSGRDDGNSQDLFFFHLYNDAGTIKLANTIYHDGTANREFGEEIRYGVKYGIMMYWGDDIDSYTWYWWTDGPRTDNTGSLTGSATGWRPDTNYLGSRTIANDGTGKLYIDNYAENATEMWRPRTYTATDKDDTWIDEANPTATDGSGSYLYAKYSATGNLKHALVCQDWQMPLPMNWNYRTSGGSLASFGTSSRQKISQRFQVAENYTVEWVNVEMYSTGTPTDNVTLSIQTDSSGSPSGTTVGNTATIASNKLIGSGRSIRTAICGSQLTGSTTYHLVIERSGTLDGTNYYSIASNPDRNTGAGSRPIEDQKVYNGTVWSEDGDRSVQYMLDSPYQIQHGRMWISLWPGTGPTKEVVLAKLTHKGDQWVEATESWNTYGSIGWASGGTVPLSTGQQQVDNPFPVPINEEVVRSSFGENINRGVAGTFLLHSNFYIETSMTEGYEAKWASMDYAGTERDTPFWEIFFGPVDWQIATDSDVYDWGADLSADSDLPVVTDITGGTRLWFSAGAFDGVLPTLSEVAETASFRSAVEFQIAYPTSDQNEVGTWTHATTATLYEAIDDVLGVDDADVIDSP